MAPVWPSLTSARFFVSWTRNRFPTPTPYFSNAGARKLRKCRKLISPCSKLDATRRHSAIGSTSGPSTSTQAAPMAARNVDLPLPLDMVSAASPGCRKAFRRNFRSQGSKVKSSPPCLPWPIRSPLMYSSSVNPHNPNPSRLSKRVEVRSPHPTEPGFPVTLSRLWSPTP